MRWGRTFQILQGSGGGGWGVENACSIPQFHSPSMFKSVCSCNSLYFIFYSISKSFDDLETEKRLYEKKNNWTGHVVQALLNLFDVDEIRWWGL